MAFSWVILERIFIDGLLQTLAECLGRKMGDMKNGLDITCVILSLLLGTAFGRPLAGVGVGTVAAAIGVGRVMALFNRLCRSKLCLLTGVE